MLLSAHIEFFEGYYLLDEKLLILISWLLVKPADLDLHCFLKRIWNFETNVIFTVCDCAHKFILKYSFIKPGPKVIIFIHA